MQQDDEAVFAIKSPEGRVLCLHTLLKSTRLQTGFAEPKQNRILANPCFGQVDRYYLSHVECLHTRKRPFDSQVKDCLEFRAQTPSGDTLMSFPNPVTLIALLLITTAGCSKATVSKTENGTVQTQETRKKESRWKAEAGVGKQGQKIKDHNGPLATPVKALFKTKQKLVFMNVKRALDLYEIQFGYPKSHVQFMEKIIRANSIELPELPFGQRYEYDTDTHELMVIGVAVDDQ